MKKYKNETKNQKEINLKINKKFENIILIIKNKMCKIIKFTTMLR